MKKICITDIINIYEYEKMRKDFRRKIIEIKKNRRFAVGDYLTFVFESRETVIFQIQEMIRSERIVDEKAIQNEIDIYNNLIPEENELSATLLIEIVEREEIKRVLDSLKGIENNSVSLKIGNKYIIYAEFDKDQIDEMGLSAVQYLKFKLTPEQREHFLNSDDIIFICINHPKYNFYTALSDEIRSSIRLDLLE
jgi:predicted transcriptional regulator